VLDAACIDVNQTAMDYIAVGRLMDAESKLSAALSDPAGGSGHVCDGLTLHNLGTVMALSGRLAEAEAFEKRSLEALEKHFPPDHPILLRPLQSLAQIRFQRLEIARARETLQRLQSIPSERPADRAVVYGLSAELFCIERRYHEAEAEYLKALGAWEESGRGESTDVAAILDGLAALYVTTGRYGEAGRALDRSIAILTSAKEAIAWDWIKLLSTRAALHVRQHEWREAEADSRAAIAAVGRDPRLDPSTFKLLLSNYAYVLRKNHRGSEARSVEARAAALQTGGLTNAVVDISELLAKTDTKAASASTR
jgi:tetratricopeptide (TPR) repeat protein